MLPALCRSIEGRFGKRLHPASLSRVVHRLGLSRQKTRPHPGKPVELWFEML
jgi:transposase